MNLHPIPIYGPVPKLWKLNPCNNYFTCLFFLTNSSGIDVSVWPFYSSTHARSCWHWVLNALRLFRCWWSKLLRASRYLFKTFDSEFGLIELFILCLFRSRLSICMYSLSPQNRDSKKNLWNEEAVPRDWRDRIPPRNTRNKEMNWVK